MTTTQTTNIRTLQRVIESIPTSDGAGVKLRRSLGRAQGLRLDPFLMLDEFSSENPDDYIAGFPAHPHRGFETVTYILDGHMRHEDHLGHCGELKSGGVQWMSAGRGIVHSEMPQQEQGRMRGFQLWINLPAREKMKAPAYRDIQPSEIPVVALPGGGRVKVIAGTLVVDGRPIPGPLRGLTTDPLYLDVELPAGAMFLHPVKSDYNAFVYPYEGSVNVGPAGGAPASREQGSRLRDATGRESGAAPSSAGVASVSGVTSPEGARPRVEGPLRGSDPAGAQRAGAGAPMAGSTVASPPVGPLLNVTPAPVPPSDGARALKTHNAGILSAGNWIEVAAGGEDARVIVLAGRPLNEPIAQYGPFVMNTREEIEQTIRDYQNGEFTRTPA